MINKIESSAKKHNSNSGLFQILEIANKNGINDIIESDLIFVNAPTNIIINSHIKIMLCGNFIGIGKLK